MTVLVMRETLLSLRTHLIHQMRALQTLKMERMQIVLEDWNGHKDSLVLMSEMSFDRTIQIGYALFAANTG